MVFLGIFLFSLFFRVWIASDLGLGPDPTEFDLLGHTDEPSHFNWTKYWLEHRELPVQSSNVTMPDAFSRNQYESKIYLYKCI